MIARTSRKHVRAFRLRHRPEGPLLWSMAKVRGSRGAHANPSPYAARGYSFFSRYSATRESARPATFCQVMSSRKRVQPPIAITADPVARTAGTAESGAFFWNIRKEKHRPCADTDPSKHR